MGRVVTWWRMGKSGRVMWPRERDPRAGLSCRTAEAEAEIEKERLRDPMRKDLEVLVVVAEEQ